MNPLLILFFAMIPSFLLNAEEPETQEIHEATLVCNNDRPTLYDKNRQSIQQKRFWARRKKCAQQQRCIKSLPRLALNSKNG